jgi:hypothetical protein
MRLRVASALSTRVRRHLAVMPEPATMSHAERVMHSEPLA